MPDSDPFNRSYLFVDAHGEPTAAVIADLLDRAAAALRSSGEVHVRHLAFDSSDSPALGMSTLTIYYDRVERRHRART